MCNRAIFVNQNSTYSLGCLKQQKSIIDYGKKNKYVFSYTDGGSAFLLHDSNG